MTIAPDTTLEPVKRVLRTVIAVIIALATTAPWIVGLIQKTIDPSTGLTAVLAQVTIVSGAITAFAASAAGQWLFGKVGLDATAVQKLNADVVQAEADIEPAVAPVVAAVKSPSVVSAIGAADAVIAAGPAIAADAQAVAADAQTVTYGHESPEISNGGTI